MGEPTAPGSGTAPVGASGVDTAADDPAGGDAGGTETTDASTAERLLAAAVAEFTEHGLSGARVERIVRRAGVSKQLLYYYFGSKEGLFDATIAAMAERFRAINERLPERVAERPRFYAEAADADRGFVRLLQWEALERGTHAVVREDERRAYFAARVDELEQRQVAGEVPDDLDAAQLFLALQALASHPYAFPQMARHITGMDVGDPAFAAARGRFLDALAARLLGHRPDGD